jgi:ATP-dependent DNA helicase RecG
MPAETQHIEFKSGFNDEVIETLTAFANSKGGKVLVGVADKGTPVKGFTIGAESIQKWLNEIKTKTQPAIIPDAEVVKYKGVEVVEFSVQEFPVKPVGCRGRYFKRVKNSNHQLTPIEISDMNLQTLQVSWDAYPAPNVSMADIDLNKVQKFTAKVNATGRFSLSGIPEDDLKKLRLINNGKISNAALLLFAKEDTIYNVHVGRLKTPSTIIDDRILRLTLFEVVDEIMKYLVSQIKFAFEITGKTTQRTEIPEYPLPALRELVLNAVIHRDYLSPVDIQIKVFDNYITFFNPGNLFGALTIESLKTNTYQAYARNKLIAEAFYLTGDIEKYGSGFRRIKEALDDYPTMQLLCEEVPNGFLATVSYTQQKISTENVTENVTEKDTIENIDEKLDEKLGERLGENVTENREYQILNLIRIDNKISTFQLAEKLNITRRTIHRDLDKLKAKGLLERIGPDKGGYWKVKVAFKKF